MGTGTDDDVWCRDLLVEAELPLTSASRLWQEQAFSGATPERRKQILALLERAHGKIGEILLLLKALDAPRGERP